ncbi:hypothetical protein HHK36_013424 [Tetracentron sinense]|uniref:RanBP2-type domain-containing protein n=1 Tax=Tetracentron sinense TaxID=13715 RepID=A0A835DDC0_TETSI|nr:hypothetical protein HHK36_013424 [Tetracentron sinense]
MGEGLRKLVEDYAEELRGGRCRFFQKGSGGSKGEASASGSCAAAVVSISETTPVRSVEVSLGHACKSLGGVSSASSSYSSRQGRGNYQSLPVTPGPLLDQEKISVSRDEPDLGLSLSPEFEISHASGFSTPPYLVVREDLDAPCYASLPKGPELSVVLVHFLSNFSPLQKSAAKPLQVHQNYSSAAYLGSGAPSSMYMGVPPYGSSLFNGTALPPYELPFSGGSAYHYDYGSRLSAGSPYGHLHLSGPSPYASGSMLGTGGMYGMPPLMDRYGLGLPMGHAAMGARPGVFQNENPQNKAADATRDSDWTCPNCGNVNFSFRTVCNMRKCNTPKPSSQAAKSEKSSKQKMPDGSWKCEECNNINYPFRTKCNRQNCGAEKPSESKKSPAATASGDDQVESALLVFIWFNLSPCG